MNERLDLTNKDKWKEDFAKELATHFGYQPDGNFKEALDHFY